MFTVNLRLISAIIMMAFSDFALAQTLVKDALPPSQSTPAQETVALAGVEVLNAPAGMQQELTAFASARLVGKAPKSLQDMSAVAAEMTELFFKRRGEAFSRVYLPRQSLDAQRPVLTLAVLHGKLGKLVFSGASPLSREQLLRRLGVTPGAPLQVQKIERGLLLIDDLPGVALDGVSAVAGANLGESDYTIKIRQEQPFSGTLLADNYGSDATGVNRLTGQLAWANPLAIGDEVELGLTRSQKGLASARLAYSFPFEIGDTQGWKTSLAATQVNYRLVGASLSLLDAHGEARSLNAAVTYPLIRGQDTNVGLLAQFTTQAMTDDIADVRFNDKRSKAMIIGASGDLSRAWFGSAGVSIVNWSANATFGKLNILDADARSADASGPRTQGNFARANLSASLRQNLEHVHPALSVYGAVSAQYASANLDSSEKFVVAGPSAVRGYNQGEVTGDTGVVASAELRLRLPQRNGLASSLYAFRDQGKARVWAERWNVERNAQTISAFGVGVTALHTSGAFATAILSKGHGLKDGVPHDDTFAWVQLGWRY
jgi:hemolysin activation/secretion protein